jgi:signal transduction histidine kinase
MEAGLQRRGGEGRLDGSAAAMDDLAMRPTQRVIAAIGVAGLLARVAYPPALHDDATMTDLLGWVLPGVVPLFAVAVWLVHRRPDHPQARRLLLMASAVAVNTGLAQPVKQLLVQPDPSGWAVALTVLYQYSNVVSLVAAAVLLAAYPDGVVEHRWQAWVLRAMWLQLLLPPLLLVTNPMLVPDMFLPEPARVASPVAIALLAPVGPWLAAVYAGFYGALPALVVMVVRFVAAGRRQRRRMRLLVYSIGAGLAIVMLNNVLDVVGVPADSTVRRVIGVLFLPMTLAIPASIVIGVLRHRLFDIDLVVRRSVVYGTLTVGIGMIYILLSAAPGLTFGNQIPVELAVILTVLAAVLFQPLRRRLEAIADRWVFGTRVNRYELMMTFGAGLEQTVNLRELLPRLADTVRRGLAAGWVRVTVADVDAVAGEPGSTVAVAVPLERDGEVLGTLECGPKDGGYDDADRELLVTLAGQASTAIANLRLTAELAGQLEELAASRTRIVAAQDTERRRIERDIHDGVQQHVVALITKIRLARNELRRGERPADALLADVQADATELLADLRELVHGIHPPVLSDRGLVAAIETRADRLPVAIEVHAQPELRERRFGQDVEGAAYFVVCEALTNVVKHAAASTATVELSASNNHLSVAVGDDGTGAHPVTAAGYGLTNLRDRVEALGGTLRVDARPGTGTRVSAELPVGAHG